MSRVLIVPESGNLKTVARQLLELSSAVDYVSWPSAGFWVSEEVFAAWEASLPKDSSGEPVITADPKPVLTHTNPVTKVDIEVAVAREAAEEARAQRKPGRPKKIQGGQ